MSLYVFYFFFFFKQKTAYEMRISDWSSDVCSSDLWEAAARGGTGRPIRRCDPGRCAQSPRSGLPAQHATRAGEREPGNRRLAIEAFETGAVGSLLGFLDNGVRAAELRHHRAEKEDEILIFGDASFDDRQQAGMVGVRKDTPLLFPDTGKPALGCGKRQIGRASCRERVCQYV